MYTKNDLKKQLKELGIDPYGTLKVHISYKSLGKIRGRADAVLDALIEYMEPGLLVFPSHTWHITEENPVMDVLYTPTCVGILTEMFRTRPGVIRSLHPTHAVAALGADAASFVAGEEKIETPCGVGGAHYKLWERDAQILLIGVNFSRSTYIHGIEEWENAAGAISKDKTDLYVINHEGRRLYTPQYRHEAPLGSETFVKLETPAVIQGVLTFGRFGDADARLAKAAPLRALAAGFLKEDPTYLLRF
ncbi:MAG: AAC(3) family N-acetyltransferase [Lachnospiraceae bacterium]|nr:AAC(3) family N-acetyltransferase [Lachnospiraceae bacterium]